MRGSRDPNRADQRQIRRLSVDEVRAITKSAAESARSARGRPEWLEKNASVIQFSILQVFGRESEGVMRCMITSVMESGAPRWFTVDVAVTTLKRIPRLGRADLATLVGQLLDHAVHVPVEE